MQLDGRSNQFWVAAFLFRKFAVVEGKSQGKVAAFNSFFLFQPVVFSSSGFRQFHLISLSRVSRVFISFLKFNHHSTLYGDGS